MASGQLRKEEVSIFAKVTEGRENRFELRTGEKIEPKYWDFKSQQVKSTYRGHYEVNAMLQELKTKLLKLYRDNQNLSFAQFKALAQEKPNQEKKTLFIALDQFLKQYGAQKDSKTLGKYNVMAKQLAAFDKVYPIDFHDLDFKFYDNFKDHLYAIPNPNYRKYSLVHSGLDSGVDSGEYLLHYGNEGTPVGIFDDTVYKYLVNLKTFLAWAEKRGHQVHQSFKSWEIIERNYPPITLSLGELETLETFEYTEDVVLKHCKFNVKAKKIQEVVKALEIARDYLVFECRTGQRISDIKRFDLKDYSDQKWTFTPRKGNRISSKVNTVHFKGYCAPALHILHKYDWKMPQVSEQKINENIKTACKIAGIKQEVVTYRWAQNKRIRISGPKYEFMSSHIGRKSFITIGLQFLQPKLVKDLAGIDSWQTLKHYEGNSEDSTIEKALEKIPVTLMRKAN